ncbi:MAG: hypothetical protein JW955_03075 [Sedimentisphaerales bacterium]|nr:hypothetical protein [Sedimentisphaerales bacterium]
MARKRPIRHMGMTLSEEEHRLWHEQHKGKHLTPEEHRKLMEHLGVSDREDRKWHKAKGMLPVETTEPLPEGDPVNCFAIGGGFLEYCVRQGWLIRQRQGKATRYYVTEAGREALAGYGITKY